MEISENYAVIDRGYGVVIKHRHSAWSCFLQGDDATEFVAEIDAIDSEDIFDAVCSEYHACLGESE